MRRAGAVLLVGALAAGGTAAAFAVFGESPEAAPPAVAATSPGSGAPDSVRSEPTRRVRADRRADEVGREVGPADEIEAWVRDCCVLRARPLDGSGRPIRAWELPRAELVRALLEAARRDDIDWSPVAALEAIGELGYLAAPWAAEVAAFLADPRLREPASVVLAAMGPSALDVLRAVAANADPSVRIGVMRALEESRYRRQEVVEIAVAALSDPDPKVRLAAIDALAKHDEAPALSGPALASLLAADDERVQRAAMRAIGRHGGQASLAVPALLGLIDDARGDVPGATVELLGRIGSASERAVPALLEIVAADPGFHGGAVTWAVLEIEPDAFVAALSDPREEVRAAFAKNADAYARRFPEREAEVLEILHRLAREESAVGAAARQGAAVIDARQTAALVHVTQLEESLRAAAAADDPPAAFVMALQSVRDARPAPTSMAPQLRELLTHADARVRLHAALAVWIVDPPARDVEPLLRSFRSDESLRRELYVGLQRRPPEGWAEHLVAALRASSEGAMQSALVAMLANGGPAAIEPIARWLREETDERRLVAGAGVLHQIGTPAAVAVLRDVAGRPGLPELVRIQILMAADTVR